VDAINTVQPFFFTTIYYIGGY